MSWWKARLLAIRGAAATASAGSIPFPASTKETAVPNLDAAAIGHWRSWDGDGPGRPPRVPAPLVDDAPMQLYATPEELGASMVYLVSDASSFMTGSVHGGYTLW